MNTFGMLPLNDGADMPRVGVVSFRRNSIKELREHLTNCVERGMRHFELSDLYGNADVVISHLMTQEVPREEFFITLKVAYMLCMSLAGIAKILISSSYDIL